MKHFHDLFPSLTEKEVRQTLGAYLFGGRDACKKVSALSGGKQSRREWRESEGYWLEVIEENGI